MKIQKEETFSTLKNRYFSLRKEKTTFQLSSIEKCRRSCFLSWVANRCRECRVSSTGGFDFSSFFPFYNIQIRGSTPYFFFFRPTETRIRERGEKRGGGSSNQYIQSQTPFLLLFPPPSACVVVKRR